MLALARLCACEKEVIAGHHLDYGVITDSLDADALAVAMRKSAALAVVANLCCDFV